MKPISKPKPLSLTLILIVICAVVLSGFLYPIYIEMDNLIFANTEMINASQAILLDEREIMESSLQKIEDETGIRLFDNYKNLSNGELFAGIYAARMIIVYAWGQLFQLIIGLLVWFAIFAALIAMFVMLSRMYEVKGWRVRKRYMYTVEKD